MQLTHTSRGLLALAAACAFVSLHASAQPASRQLTFSVIDEPIPQGELVVGLEEVAGGMVAPLGVDSPGSADELLFIYDQVGLVWAMVQGEMQETPVLDIRDRLVAVNPQADERGLLGFALHPEYPEEPYFYTYSSENVDGEPDFDPGLEEAPDHHSVIAEWMLGAETPYTAVLESRREILRIAQPHRWRPGVRALGWFPLHRPWRRRTLARPGRRTWRHWQWPEPQYLSWLHSAH